MAVLQMQRINICALKKDRKQILEVLQRRGVVEPCDLKAEDELFQQENVEWIQQQGLYVWVNVITLSSLDKHRLYGGLDDDTALLDNPDKSWGVLLQRGIDILQTDWPMQLSRYRDAYFGL